MKKAIALLICFIIIVLFCACDEKTPSNSSVASESASPPESEPLFTSSPDIPEEPSEPSPPDSGGAEESASAEPDETGTPRGMSPTPSSSVRMYSSYAHMVSFDPARGWADFDYFDLLQGEAAVEWLVEEEGYTLAEAEAKVADFADSEFIEKNTNPQLRTIDLREIPLKLMYHPDGAPLPGAEPIDADIGDLYTLYEHHPDLVLDSFFYYVKVAGGEVTSVRQVYWP